MSFVSRVAAAAAMTLSILGLAAQSSAGLAAGTERATLPDAVASATPAPAAQLPDPAPTVLADDVVQPGDSVAYPTLAAAVAAQPTDAEVDAQLRCLAGAIYYESKGEPLAGQLAVAEVILNRADNGRFGNSICSVITQPGQFSFVRGGRMPDVDESRPAWRTALAVAKVAMADSWNSSVGSALYFHARRVAPGWGRVKVAAIGNHVFYR